MFANRTRTFACAAALALSLLPAVALGQGLPVGWGWATGDGGLSVSVEAFDVVEDIEMSIRRHSDGRRFDFDFGDMRLGAVETASLPMPDRTSEYTITITGRFADVPGRVEDVFEIAVMPPLEFDVDESTFDEERRFFELTMTQPAERVEVVVRSDTGALLAERVIRFEGEPPGTRLPITWVQQPATILTIDVKVVGPTGEWASRRYVPWRVEFEPAFVNFATGSAEIPSGDVAMLRSRLDEILETAGRVSEWVDVQLYVAGYTDTVGSPADNRALSEARAQSIARYFRDNGVSFPIFTQGFGEEGLAVPTEDNVDEPQNRRSIFVLTTRQPDASEDFPGTRWRRLD
jgi:outer membrane protein OmpA-like peptidoglycan-associated protein